VAEIIALDSGLFRTFVDETDVLMEQAGRGVEALADSAASNDALAAVFRAVHTFKSNARIFKLTTVQNAAHDLEELLAELRDRHTVLSFEDLARVKAGLVGLQTLRAEFETLAAKIFGPLRGESASAGGALPIGEAKITTLRRTYAELSRALRAVQPPSAIKEPAEAVGVAVIQLTRVPMSALVDRFRKMLLDLAQELGREVEDLSLEGADVEIDLKLVQLLRDVLAHALRNAVDHGVEEPAARLRAGKPAKGKVSIACTLDDATMKITVSDDGRGVDYERVRSRAVISGLLPADRAALATPSDLQALLFLPGFSTAERVTAISGRGVGMDVMHTAMRSLKGDVSLDSTPGRGTRVVLRLPSDYYLRL
ncbi:MAG: Hpt domain-containing protein, partial [Clostridia bacterium]|nr:Hpt domain-containing protein [Deltaproteobacteria bacterium]